MKKWKDYIGLDGRNAENVGVVVDFGSDSEDEDLERNNIEKKHGETRDFVKCHPVPSPHHEEGDKFWKKVIDRMKEEGANGMIIYSFVRVDIMKHMYENLTD